MEGAQKAGPTNYTEKPTNPLAFGFGSFNEFGTDLALWCPQ